MRVGTHGQFFSSMLSRLSGPAYPALRGLRVRRPDDPAIALLDTGAVLGDLLTFYTERIAVEGYLRTAIEERSLRLLGKLVGHVPRPGVGAGVHLAYTVDRDPLTGEDVPVAIPQGARSQSVPGPGEEPQSFETAEDLIARNSWNQLQVRTRKPYQVNLGTTGIDRRVLHLAGASTNLDPGDRLLFVFGTETGRQALDVVQSVEIDSINDTTAVGLPGPSLPTFLGLNEQFRTLVADAHEHEMFGRSRIVRRFVEVLDDIVARLPELPDEDLAAGAAAEDEQEIDTPTKFGSELDTALERLAESLQVAHQYENVVAYLTELGAALAGLRAQVALLEPPQERPKESRPQPLYEALALYRFSGGGGENGSVGNGSQPPADDPALLGLAALLGALRLPPASPPRSAKNLVLDPAKVFGTGSDAGVQLLSALDPRLGNLYNAWAKVNLTAPPALAGLQAMRVVATPFGATAPLRQVTNPSTGRQEFVDWPLIGAVAVTAQVLFSGERPSLLFLTFTENNVSQVQLRFLPFDGTIENFGPGRARVTTKTTGSGEDEVVTSVEVEYLDKLPNQTVTLSAIDSEDVVTITVSDGDELSLELEEGQVKEDVHDGFSVTARRSGSGQIPFAEVEIGSGGQPVSRDVLALDAVYQGIGPGSWVVIDRPGKGNPTLRQLITRVESSRVISRADFGITGKVTELTLVDEWLDENDSSLADIRNTTVYSKGEALEVATEPVTDDVFGDTIELAQLYDGLQPGRWIVVTGERTDIPDTPGVRAAELTMISGLEHDVAPPLPGDSVHSTITLVTPLAFTYRRETVSILGNVVRADQGATRDEPIGSGDASQAGQSFRLFQGPLTWLPADNPSGARSTLEIRVDGVRWDEVDSLAGRGADEKVYVTSTGDDGRTLVTFGDGVHGSRLPTGQENVRARYRVGLGKAGNVVADKITTPLTRPLGVTAVTNPRPATGGANPDDAAATRRQIPLAISALDRLVSVPDYEDFARARAGIGRASAARLVAGGRELVHVTVAGVDDIPLADDSDLVSSLRSALVAFGDPQLPVAVAVRELVLLIVSAGIRVAPAYSWELVEPVVRAALVARLGFGARELGQPAYLSEVIAAAQSVPGVDYVDVDAFTGVPASITPVGLQELAAALTTPQNAVPARLAIADEASYVVELAEGESLTLVAAKNGITVAELLRLNPDISSADPLPAGRRVRVFAGVRPAQLVSLSAAVPSTLVLKEIR
ncbi:putative baseplate assembly protein [Flindersiella endophytica]